MARKSSDDRLREWEAKWQARQDRIRVLADLIKLNSRGMDRSDILDAIRNSVESCFGRGDWWYEIFDKETLRLVREVHAHLLVSRYVTPETALVVAVREFVDAIPPFAFSDDAPEKWPGVKPARQKVIDALADLVSAETE